VTAGPHPLERPALAPLIAPEQLERWAQAQRDAGRTIVFTNGCFDLLHEGHVRSLLAAAELGDVLLVAINSDASVRQLKGEGRPVLAEPARALLLQALRPVSAVTIFTDLSSLATILTVRPDVLAKGGQYTPEQIVGSSEVAAWGGRVVRLPMIEGVSTTALVGRLRGPRTARGGRDPGPGAGSPAASR
jgi:rfaE bifunctional protein nucleotidyltransferase chain/domain